MAHFLVLRQRRLPYFLRVNGRSSALTERITSNPTADDSCGSDMTVDDQLVLKLGRSTGGDDGL